MSGVGGGRAPLRVSTEPPWLRRFLPAGRTRLRFACLPHAGGGGSVFAGWVPLLSEGVELVAVVLPGREARVHEPASADFTSLVAELSAALDLADDVPLALFGHSLGAAIMFEVARRLNKAARPDVAHLIVSGFHAPHNPSALPPLSHLPRAELVAALNRLNGIHPEVLAHDEFLDVVLRTVRADLRLAERYRCVPGPPLTCPITVFVGANDPMTSPAALEGWCTYTTAECRRHTFTGDHFFYLSQPAVVVETINRVLAPHVSA